MSLQKEKENFVEDEIWILTFGGALQRANVYAPSASVSDRENFRESIKAYLREQVRKHYESQQVGSDAHVRNIKAFCDHISDQHKNTLLGERLRIGVGQKLFNLHLKYLWCLGKIQIPPHCPFDRIMILKLGLKSPPNWTVLDDLEKYKELVVKASEIAHSKGKSIAEWELAEYARRQSFESLF